MDNYNDPSRWLILQYRPGAGGKFLCAALMTIDCVAHWDPRVEHQEITYKQWASEQWKNISDNNWIAREPLHIWDTRFFSRTFPRGEDLTIDHYNQLIHKTASEYFKEVWATDKIVLDFINKSNIPVWWENSHIVRLDSKINCPIHRQMLLSKIYPYDPVTGIGMFMMDHPLPENPSPNARVYKNQFEFGKFNNQDEWYRYIWEKDFRLNFTMPNEDLLLNDLLNFDSLNQIIQKISRDLNSKHNQSDLKYIWDIWMFRQEKILKSIDSLI